MGCEQLIERKKSRIIVEQDNGEPIVAGDRTQLLQLIQNLVVNALKYGRDSEDVTVRFEGAGPDMIRMRVIDRGEGIAPEHRSEEQTSELQSLMRSSYAVFCLKKKK